MASATQGHGMHEGLARYMPDVVEDKKDNPETQEAKEDKDSGSKSKTLRKSIKDVIW